MNLKAKFFYWLPRLLGILTVLFIGILSGIRFDGSSFSSNEWSVMMNLIPALIILMILVFSFYRELSGGIVFILIGLFLIHLFTKNTSPIQEPSIYGLVFGILMTVTGILFVLSYISKKRE